MTTRAFLFAAVNCVALVFTQCSAPPEQEPQREATSQEKLGSLDAATDAGSAPNQGPEQAQREGTTETAPERHSPERHSPERHSPERQFPEPTSPKDILPKPSTGWCSRIATGPQSQQKEFLALSKAHAHIRFLGIHKGYPTLDATLAKALSRHAIAQPKLLTAYADSIDSVCALSANEHTLPKASLRMEGSTAILRPGTGPLTLPSGTKAVIVDLRDLPNTEESNEAVKRTVALALAQDTSLSTQKVRAHQGLKDEHFSATNMAYNNNVQSLSMPKLKAAGQISLPLAFLVGETISPMAATIAGSLRLQQRAWLIGLSVPAAAAESRWVGIGRAGLAFRTKMLYHNNVPWPDSIPADTPHSALSTFAKSLPQKGPPSKVLRSQPQREDIKAYTFFRQHHREVATKANVSAALLITHGALRAFFPYFQTVGDNIDARLEEGLDALNNMIGNELSGIDSRNFLRRFGEAIKDGHNFVYSLNTGRQYVGFMPMTFDLLQNKPVVVRSGVPGIQPGDTLNDIDGISATEWLTREYRRTSAATPGYLFNLAAHELQNMTKAIQLKVTTAKGASKTIQVAPQSYQAYRRFTQSAKVRRAGFLKDLGAPKIYYINLDGKAIQQENINQLLTEAQTAKGLVLDMRGYPGAKASQLLPHLSTSPIPSPFFRMIHWDGTGTRKVVQTNYSLPPKAPPLLAPAVYLVGPGSASAAEHLGTMLKQAKRVTFMGRRSAGTNGNITGLVLPGGLVFSFTGTEIRWRDNRIFHGIGLKPVTEFEPTPQDIAAGKDPLLRKAITHLSKTQSKP